MKKIVIAACCILATETFAQSKTKFPLGNGVDDWGVPVKVTDSDLALKLGARFQSLSSVRTTEDHATDSTTTSQDFEARRVRLNLEAKLPNSVYFQMDLRNDRANRNDNGNEGFEVGDAFVAAPLLMTDNFIHILRAYRAKVDVSRSQTASSAELIFVNRPQISDYAGNFVNHNRRASNVQLIGGYKKKIRYQLAIGDGVNGEDFTDARGRGLDGSNGIDRQNFMLGGKLVFYPITGWEELKPKETYFGEGKHFSIGAGFFNTSNIFVDAPNATEKVSRNLTNIELSAHYYDWFIEAEYFVFDGVIENNQAANLNVGKSEGWYIQGEKTFPNFHWLAPFVRYENWDRFITSGEYLTTAQMYGLNWYANGNRFKMSLVYEINTNGDDGQLPDRAELYHIATAWQF